MRFRAFIEEDSAAVIAQIRDIRDQMRVIKIKRDLEKEKYELQKLKQQKSGEGVIKHRYSLRLIELTLVASLLVIISNIEIT